MPMTLRNVNDRPMRQQWVNDRGESVGLHYRPTATDRRGTEHPDRLYGRTAAALEQLRAAEAESQPRKKA